LNFSETRLWVEDRVRDRVRLRVRERLRVTLTLTLRADFSVLLGTSRYYYDVQVVAINKDSARTDPYSTLAEAAAAKKRRYASLGVFFKPLIFSAGGLMEKDTAKTYKGLQKLLGPSSAKWLDTTIALALTQARALSAASIARSSPRRT
jgi:hypothetical protein